MNLEHVQQTFLAESRELLREMETGLLRLEKSPDDAEIINAVLRAAHTIKGSSGVFSFDAIVEFTHAMESLLEEIRSGRIAIDKDLIALLLKCGDHVSSLLDCLAADDAREAFDQVREAGALLVKKLNGYLDAVPAGLPAVGEPLPDQKLHRIGGGQVTSDSWHISLRFDRDVLRHGIDPLSMVRYLGTLGKIVAINATFDAMPEARDMDAESCYLGLEIDFSGNVSKEAIESVFEHVRDDCAVRILPPHSRISDYIELINSLPEDKTWLGDLLVQSGALTRRELEEGLRLQQNLDAQSGAKGTGHAHKIGEILVGQGVVQNELVDAAVEKQDLIKKNKALENSFIRVSADKLDELINLVGELVIASAGTNLAARRAASSEMIEAISTTARLVEEVRDSALKLRMVPIGQTFGRFDRVVRDLGRELGKDVELVLSGTETELDKSMVEKISDPLMHLVRNALDHGIESPAVRQARGKPARGTLQLNAYQESGTVVIEVADDGGGLDRKKILVRAIERGLATLGQNLTDQEILNFSMESGFSTAEQITNISGRGIGMNVLRRNVESLRGTIGIESVAGEGTTIVMRLPLTLAIIDGFLVGVGRSTYVVPLDMVVECMELSAEDRASVRESGYINLRGEVLPLLRLRDVFEVTGEPAKRENIVVVQYAGQRAGFVVDALMGEFQTVIKPLGKLFERLSGIGGSTILGTGEVALILDVQALVQRAIGTETAREKSAGEHRLLERR
jgi:two-component system chemotaxis sensor kinase CheA